MKSLDYFEEECPQEGQGGNELHTFPLLGAQNQLFSSLPLLDSVNMPLENCGEISLVERRWGYLLQTDFGR